MEFDFDRAVESVASHEVKYTVYKEGEGSQQRAKIIGYVDREAVVVAEQGSDVKDWKIEQSKSIKSIKAWMSLTEEPFEYLSAVADCLKAVETQCIRSSVASVARLIAVGEL